MEYSWEEWAKHGAYWKGVIGVVEKAAKRFVEKYGLVADIDTFNWDMPDVLRNYLKIRSPPLRHQIAAI